VDWPACKAHGVCGELLPEIVELDEWGYPVIAPGPVPDGLKRYSERAVSSCPTLALRLVPFNDAPAASAPPEGAAAAQASPASRPPAHPGAEPFVTTTEVSPRRRARRSS
jgi:ferredoxin